VCLSGAVDALSPSEVRYADNVRARSSGWVPFMEIAINLRLHSCQERPDAEMRARPKAR